MLRLVQNIYSFDWTPEETDLYKSQDDFRWPESTWTYGSWADGDIFFSETEEPTIMAGADSGWTSCGPQFNSFDKETLRGCLEWRIPASDQAFTYVEYLMHDSN